LVKRLGASLGKRSEFITDARGGKNDHTENHADAGKNSGKRSH